MNQPTKTINRLYILLAATLVVLFVGGFVHAGTAGHGKYHNKLVDCDKGDSLRKAVRRARSGTTVHVTGTCYERIVMKRDNVRIIGHDGAAIDGSTQPAGFVEFTPMVRITDATGIRLKNLIVRHSPGEGILVQGQASAKLRNIQVHQNANTGLLVDQARVELRNSKFDQNLSGVDATNNASLILRGQVSAQSNLGLGFAVSNAASAELRGGVLNASSNQGFGVVVEGEQLAIFNFGVSQGSQIIADTNGACGIALVAGGLVDIIAPPPLYFSGANQVSAQHNGCGMLLTTGSRLESPFGAATFQIANNQVGMQILGNSDVFVNGGLNVSNNATGMVADGAGTITLASADGSVAPLSSTISGNAAIDAVMNFGSRATFGGNVSVGSLVCDGTALVRGTTTCP